MLRCSLPAPRHLAASAAAARMHSASDAAASSAAAAAAAGVLLSGRGLPPPTAASNTVDRLNSLRELLDGRFAVAAAPQQPSNATPTLETTQGGRLEALRGRLNSESAGLSNFVPAGAAAPGMSPSASVAAGLPSNPAGRKPEWLKISAPSGEHRAAFDRMQRSVKSLNLATVCEEAKCPNIGACWGGKEGTATATIMLMGDTCTRGCSFCAVKTSRSPPPLDAAEPRRVSEAIASWGLGYVVLTSVDRDDLADQGSGHFAATVSHLKRVAPQILVECLTPDFRGSHECIDAVARSGLDVFAHNVETTERLQARVRDRRAGWRQSLGVLERAKVASPGLFTKTSIMLGVGETPGDLRAAMRGLRDAGIDIITFGQYLRPSKRHMPVDRYVTPAEFDGWAEEARAMGFVGVFSGPLVRSSYKAGELFIEQILRQRQAAAAAQAAVGVGAAASG